MAALLRFGQAVGGWEEAGALLLQALAPAPQGLGRVGLQIAMKGSSHTFP